MDKIIPSKVYRITFDVTPEEIIRAHLNGCPWPPRFTPGTHTVPVTGTEVILYGLGPYIDKPQ